MVFDLLPGRRRGGGLEGGALVLEIKGKKMPAHLLGIWLPRSCCCLPWKLQVCLSANVYQVSLHCQHSLAFTKRIKWPAWCIRETCCEELCHFVYNSESSTVVRFIIRPVARVRWHCVTSDMNIYEWHMNRDRLTHCTIFLSDRVI